MPSVDSPSQPQKEESAGLDLNFQLRQIINNAVGAVQGRQASQSFAALTYEELADQMIERITGPGTDVRPNELVRVDKIEGDLLSVINQIRNTPPEQFLMSDSKRDVNTPVVPEE